MMNRYAAVALTVSSGFRVVMGVLVNSSLLFIMAAAIIATILAARLQARLAVRSLRFERYTAPAVKVGELVTVEVIVWSERRIKRPLVTIVDLLPPRMIGPGNIYSLPVAPSFDQPIKTRYSFRPIRRGRYKWSRLTVTATDALGMVTQSKQYTTDPVELTVYPAPIQVNEEVNPLTGWGASSLDEGRLKGAGLEPHGVREYAQGDPLRYVHWRSSARRGKLMVKEFEAGSGVLIHFLLQKTAGTEVSDRTFSTFEAMCGNALYLASDFLKKGATVLFPVEESREQSQGHSELRERQVREVLTDIQPVSTGLLSQDVAQARQIVRAGETVVIFVAIQDSLLPSSIASWPDVQVTCFVYEASEYGPIPQGSLSAADPVYIGQLESCGARVVVLPRMEHLV